MCQHVPSASLAMPPLFIALRVVFFDAIFAFLNARDPHPSRSYHLSVGWHGTVLGSNTVYHAWCGPSWLGDSNRTSSHNAGSRRSPPPILPFWLPPALALTLHGRPIEVLDLEPVA